MCEDDHFVLFVPGYIWFWFWLIRSYMLTEFLSHEQGFMLSKSVPADICIVISGKSPEAVLTYVHLHDVEWGTIDSEPPKIVSPWFRTPVPLELTRNVNIWCDMKNTHM